MGTHDLPQTRYNVSIVYVSRFLRPNMKTPWYLLILFLHSFSPSALHRTFVVISVLSNFILVSLIAGIIISMIAIIIFYFIQTQIRKALYWESKLLLEFSNTFRIVAHVFIMPSAVRNDEAFPAFF